MGDPKKRRRKYSKPRKSFQKERIEKEREQKKVYGLKNKREYYRAESLVRAKRATARKLLALSLENRLKREKELLDSLLKMGVLNGKPTLEDVLLLTPDALLERRLQTIVWRKGLATTTKQARQFIVHGHIEINGGKVDRPSYLVTAEEEGKIKYHKQEMILEEKKNSRPKATDGKVNEIQKEFEEAKPKTGEEKNIKESDGKVASEKKSLKESDEKGAGSTKVLEEIEEGNVETINATEESD